jgi:hypothetical protein
VKKLYIASVREVSSGPSKSLTAALFNFIRDINPIQILHLPPSTQHPCPSFLPAWLAPFDPVDDLLIRLAEEEVVVNICQEGDFFNDRRRYWRRNMLREVQWWDAEWYWVPVIG